MLVPLVVPLAVPLVVPDPLYVTEGKKSPQELDRLLDDNKRLQAQMVLQNDTLAQQLKHIADSTSAILKQATGNEAGGFAVVLLDGDFDIFDSWYLGAGRLGGQRAARDLENRVSEHIRKINPADSATATVTAMSFMSVYERPFIKDCLTAC